MIEADLLIRGGLVYDGSGSAAVEAGIVIKDGKILSISPQYTGKNSDVSPREVLDAGGLTVTPGFIDVHSHSDFTLLADPQAAEGKLFQGVTTEVNGNCGMSGGPLYGPALERRESEFRELGIKPRWNTLSEFLGLIEATQPYMNFATLAGHGNIRGSVIGYADIPTPDEAAMARMLSLMRDAVTEGAIGLSSGLIYPPGVYSATEELCRLAEAGSQAARQGGKNFLYNTHMRSEGDRLIEALEEAVSIGRAAGALNVSHFKTSGPDNWPKLGKAIETLDNARASGLKTTADRYPYTAASTDLDIMLPNWAYEGGAAAELARLKDPSTAKRITEEVLAKKPRWHTAYVSSTPYEADRWMEGRNLEEIAARTGEAPVKTLFGIIIRSEARAGGIFHGMSEENLERIYGLPWVMVGSDSSARAFAGTTAVGKPHPRAFGTFPRFIKRYTIEKRIITLAEAVRRTTSLAANVFGLEGRGLLKPGHSADIAVFASNGRFFDNATFEDPYRKADGLVHLVINGKTVIRDGALTRQRCGKVLRNGRG
ncbi:MAG: D-aminoacylase [Nitrospiraceae bacterium]|nr:D-aminoacylase [Nitrospiraceae bacterium]